MAVKRLIETDLCIPGVIPGLSINLKFCLKSFLNGSYQSGTEVLQQKRLTVGFYFSLIKTQPTDRNQG